MVPPTISPFSSLTTTVLGSLVVEGNNPASLLALVAVAALPVISPTSLPLASLTAILLLQ
jgi:lipopolysaccharide export LptBFGC system permease protein LptF